MRSSIIIYIIFPMETKQQQRGSTNLYMTRSEERNYEMFKKFQSIWQLGQLIYQQFRQIKYRCRRAQQRIMHLDNRTAIFTANKFQQKQLKKKMRRTSDQILKDHRCTVVNCQKQYGSHSSLRVHFKLQHPDLYIQFKRGRKSLKT